VGIDLLARRCRANRAIHAWRRAMTRSLLRSLGDEDPYRLLAVDRLADHDTIVAAYRRRIREVHPDLPTGSVEKARLLNIARDVLLDPQLRAEYDRSVTHGDSVHPGDAPWTSAWDDDDILTGPVASPQGRRTSASRPPNPPTGPLSAFLPNATQSPHLAFSPEAHQQGWRAAYALFQHLGSGGFAQVLPSHDLLLFPGEQCYADLPLEHARYYGIDTYYYANAVDRARAAKLAAAQWRDISIARVVATSARLLCHVSSSAMSRQWDWLEFRHDSVFQLLPEPAAYSFTLVFRDDFPLRVRGPGAVWLSILLVWILQGPQQLVANPALTLFRDTRL
jgi:hypothetical protein